MGRPPQHRDGVERAAHDLLAGGQAMPQRELFATIRQRTKASDTTIRKWLRPLCEAPAKRGGPRDASAAWLWRLAPNIAAIEPNIAATEPNIAGTDSSAPKMPATRGRADDQPKTRSLHAQHRVRGHASEIAGTGGPLLDADPRSGVDHLHGRPDERAAALRAFGECLAAWRWPLKTINLTVKDGNRRRWAVAWLTTWVAERGGGIWLVPHKVDTPGEHNHGLLAHEDESMVLRAWIGVLGGLAALDQQRVEPVTDLPGWIAYCRHEPGFDLAHVTVSGWLREPWIWALGRAGYMPSEPRGLASVPTFPG